MLDAIVAYVTKGQEGLFGRNGSGRMQTARRGRQVFVVLRVVGACSWRAAVIYRAIALTIQRNAATSN